MFVSFELHSLHSSPFPPACQNAIPHSTLLRKRPVQDATEAGSPGLPGDAVRPCGRHKKRSISRPTQSRRDLRDPRGKKKRKNIQRFSLDRREAKRVDACVPCVRGKNSRVAYALGPIRAFLCFTIATAGRVRRSAAESGGSDRFRPCQGPPQFLLAYRRARVKSFPTRRAPSSLAM